MNLIKAIGAGIIGTVTLTLPACNRENGTNNSAGQTESQITRSRPQSLLKQIPNIETKHEIDVTQIRNYIIRNKSQPYDVFSKAIKERDILLVGDVHDQIWIEKLVKNSLSKLQKEGLTHIVLEIHSKHQEFVDSLNYKNKDVEIALTNKICIRDNLIYVPRFDVLIEAKKLGLNVICADCFRSEYDSVYPYFSSKLDQWELDRDNWREQKNFERIKNQFKQLSPPKTLIFYGTAHVPKSAYMRSSGGNFVTLGKYLSDQYGIQNIVSFRCLPANDYLDESINSNGLPKLKLKNIIIVEEPFLIPDNKSINRFIGIDYIIVGKDLP